MFVGAGIICERRFATVAMKKKNVLQSLSKLELLELLAEQENEIQKLKTELEEKENLLAQRTICMEQSGSIAQAALALNGVFEAAEKAAQAYVESVKQMTDRKLRKGSSVSDELEVENDQGDKT